ncbi:complement component C8 gamma chain [Polypterus senegalus]
MAARWLCLLVLSGLLSGGSGALPKKRKEPEKPLDKIAIQKGFNLDQFLGKWYLVGVASKCNYLRENNFRVEATTIQLSRPADAKETVAISTLRKLNLQCWDLRHTFALTDKAGKFVLKGKRKANDLTIVVGDTDYTTYAIMYLQQQNKITMKLYGRSVDLSDQMIEKFEGLAGSQGITQDLVYYFPRYGFCDTVDESYTVKM